MKLASAQIESTVGDIEGNLKKHSKMIRLAAQSQADLIVFPEMSITGYCREEGKELALTEADARLNILKESAKKHRVIIVAGAPIAIENALYIGSFIFKPDGNTEIYTKQYLHEGEEEFYSSSFDYNPTIKIDNELIIFAICADIDNEQHPKDAKSNQCTIYMPSIFFSKKGINEGHHLLSEYAQKYSFSVLMSNYSGYLWNIEAGGRSSFWDDTGLNRAQLSPNKEGLLIMEKAGNTWINEIYE